MAPRLHAYVTLKRTIMKHLWSNLNGALWRTSWLFLARGSFLGRRKSSSCSWFRVKLRSASWGYLPNNAKESSDNTREIWRCVSETEHDFIRKSWVPCVLRSKRRWARMSSLAKDDWREREHIKSSSWHWNFPHKWISRFVSPSSRGHIYQSPAQPFILNPHWIP
jgi:hypothetical protein